MKLRISRLLIFLYSLLMMTNAQAQNYDALWQACDKAFDKDLPRTALTHVQNIRDKAMAEGNQPQLLRALATECTLATEISPDSAASVIACIDTALQQPELSAADQAMWWYVKARLTNSRKAYLTALQDYAMLSATPAANYVPAVVTGYDSKWLGDDLLSLFVIDMMENAEVCWRAYDEEASEADDCLTREDVGDVVRDVYCYYENTGNEMALMMLAHYDQAHEEYLDVPTDVQIERIRRLAPKMKPSLRSEKIGGEAANVLLAWVDQQEAPAVRLNIKADRDGSTSPTRLSLLLPSSRGDRGGLERAGGEAEESSTAYYPGSTAKLEITSRNLAEIEVRLYRFGDDRREFSEEVIGADKVAKLLKSKGVTFATSRTIALETVPAHEYHEKEVDYTLPDQMGHYMAVLCIDGKPLRGQWIHVTRLRPLTFSGEWSGKALTRLTLVDARTGRPLTEGVKVEVKRLSEQRWYRYGGNSDEKSPSAPWTTLQTNADGTVDLNLQREGRYLVAVEAMIDGRQDAFFPPYEYYYSGRQGFSTGGSARQTFGRLYTDRAIYRPGQKVMFGGIVYDKRKDVTRPVAGLEVEVELQDTERKTVQSLYLTTDEMGGINGEFTLPAHVVPGRWALVVRSEQVRCTEYVSVEEYRRPTLRMTLDRPSTEANRTLAEGDTLHLTGRIETWSGIGVPDTQVTWKTECRNWPWLRRYKAPTSPTSANVLTGEVTTDAEGRFVIAVPLTEEGYHITTAEATAANGETVTASHALWVGSVVSAAEQEETAEDPERTLLREEKSADGTATTLHVDLGAMRPGATRPHTLYYTAVATRGGIIEERRITVGECDSIAIPLAWKADYGDGAVGYVALVSDGELCSLCSEVRRPLPDKRLLLQWSTFRDALQPGAEETWTLKVTHPDGTPADARLMARLYDASLDALANRPWSFDIGFDRLTPDAYWKLGTLHDLWMNYEKTTSWPGNFRLTQWQPTMFDYYAEQRCEESLDVKAAPMMAGAAPKMRLMAAETAGAMYDEAPIGMSQANGADEMTEAETAEVAQTQVRENFDETAFFMPALRTDAEGRVTLCFTLPDCLTQWNFTALATDGKMNYGLLNDTITARKWLTAEVAAPRFLREGDRTAVPVTVRSLSETPLDAEVMVIVTEAASGRTVTTLKKHVSLAKAGDAKMLTIDVKAEKADLIVKVVARAGEYTDGEQRLVPVLDGRTAVNRALPFSQAEAGTIEIDVKALDLERLMKNDADCHPVLSVEYTDNALWNVVRALPALLDDKAECSMEWATQLYAIETADFIAKQLPLRLESAEEEAEVRAVLDSLLRTKDIPALRYSARDHLASYQRGDGGFCWMPGLYSSLWMTTDIAILLARLQYLTGKPVPSSQQMLTRAMAYLEKEMAALVSKLKKAKHPEISEVGLRYLYVRQLMGLAPRDAETYLLGLTAQKNKDLTMYGKAAVSQILREAAPAQAALALESLLEHTVTTTEMGRYFDTQRALGGWSSYRIPSQTMAIEALAAAPKDYITERHEMELWLLQSKRTQQWESSRASADAIYALLYGSTRTTGKAEDAAWQTFRSDGYSRRALTTEETQTALKTGLYTIEKTTDGVAWGALYADYTLPMEQVEASGAGFTLTRTWEVLRDGRWQELHLNTANGKAKTAKADERKTVKVGERVRQIITLHAERDYDYVRLEAARPACLEPTHPLSGLTWQDGVIAYRMVRDASTDYYLEHVAKGTHVIIDECRADRAGQYATGLGRVQATLAPEFSAYSPSLCIFATSD